MTEQSKNPFEDPKAKLWDVKIKDYKIPRRKKAPLEEKAKPATAPISNEEIASLEQALDQYANTVVATTNSVCRLLRQRNKKRWEKFSYWCRLPVIGNLIFSLFRAPKGLERDYDYRGTSWFGSETSAIYKEAKRLEALKAKHLEYYGRGAIKPCNPADPGGHCTPEYMTRRECYAKGWTPFLPDKYDFHSTAGAGGKMKEGSFVMDATTKRIVPENQCDFTWASLRITANGLIERIIARTARSGALYYYRGYKK